VLGGNICLFSELLESLFVSFIVPHDANKTTLAIMNILYIVKNLCFYKNIKNQQLIKQKNSPIHEAFYK
jgi:hypothetical protein